MSQRTLMDLGICRPATKRKHDVSVVVDASQPPAKKAMKVRSIQTVWLKLFGWLEFVSDSNKMFSKVCRAANKQNSFTKDGAGNLQKSIVVKHNESKDHKQADEADELRRQIYNVDATDEHIQSVPVSSSEVHLFRTTYFVAKQNLPNSFVNSQLEFLAASGVDVKIKDVHSETVHDVQKSLLDVINKTLKDEMKCAKYYGVIVNESTDLSVHKNLIMYVSPKTQDIETRLVGNIRIPDGTSATIATHIQQKVKLLGLSMSDLVGLGSDGASVMFGNRAGVGQLLRANSPFLIHIHCVAHRLALACSDAAKDFTYLKTYRNTLKNLYVHVTGSGVRSFKLEVMQKVTEEPALKLKDPISIRWLAMEGAVMVVHRCYGSIVAYLQSNEGKNTVGDNIAEGLLKNVMHYKFPAFTAVLVDILEVIGILCRQLQSESLDVSQLDALHQSTVGNLLGLKLVTGVHTGVL